MVDLRNLPKADKGTAQAVSGRMAASGALAQPQGSSGPEGHVGSHPLSKAPFVSHPLAMTAGDEGNFRGACLGRELQDMQEELRGASAVASPRQVGPESSEQLVKNAGSRVPPQLLNPAVPWRPCSSSWAQDMRRSGDRGWVAGRPCYLGPHSPTASTPPFLSTLFCIAFSCSLQSPVLPGDSGGGAVTDKRPSPDSGQPLAAGLQETRGAFPCWGLSTRSPFPFRCVLSTF